MSVSVGNVQTLQMYESADKAQVLKVVEEAAEVFSAWEDWKSAEDPELVPFIVDECADVIQATCNLIAGLGVEDFAPYMESCRMRNVERGRM